MKLHKEQRTILNTAQKAMKAGLALELDYDGEHRLVEVHAAGVSRAGKPCMRVFQVHGGSLSGEETGWKLMTVDKIHAPKILDRAAEYPREGYVKGDKGMSEIFFEF